jgi:RNA polymerase sigma-70 factor, ECF subfamily
MHAKTNVVRADPNPGAAALPHVAPSARVLDPVGLGDHLDRLYRAAWALSGSREVAEDLVQDTYVRVLSRPRFLRSDDDLGYLLRVLRNTFISQHRRARSRPALVAADELDRIEDRTAAEPQAVAEGHLVYAAISALPQDFRDALVAVDVVGLPYREAARVLGVKEATLTTRLFRARQRVAGLLRPETSPREGFRLGPRPCRRRNSSCRQQEEST